MNNPPASTSELQDEINQLRTFLKEKTGQLKLVRAEGKRLRTELDKAEEKYKAIVEDTEKALRESEKLYRAIVEDQTELICRFLPDYTHTFVNKAYCDYFGHPPEEMLGHNFMVMIPEDYRSVLDGKLRNLSAENPYMTHEERTVSEMGEDRWQQWSDRAIFDDAGRLVEFQAVGRDITELKKVERALREQKRELEQKNIALKEVLEQIGMEKQNIKDEIIANVENLLLPILNKLRLESTQIEGKYLDLLHRTLEEITSSFGKRINQPSFQLTRREIEVCNMIKTGLSSKEIAELLHISPNTVGRHRNKIRSKLNLIKSDHNLSTYLSSLPTR